MLSVSSFYTPALWKLGTDNLGSQITELTTLGFDNSALEGHQCHGGSVTVKAKKPGNKENGYD